MVGSSQQDEGMVNSQFVLFNGLQPRAKREHLRAGVAQSTWFLHTLKPQGRDPSTCGLGSQRSP